MQGCADIQIDHRIAADDNGGFVEETAEILNLAHATGRTEGLGHDLAMFARAFVGIAEINAPATAIAKVVFDLVMIEGNVNHDLANAIARHVLDQVFHHRFAQDGHHRFRHVLGQRTHPCSLASRQDHSLCHLITP